MDRINIHPPFPDIDGVIVFFGKTPPSIVCPHFWELRWAFGCDFDCAYCYLQGTGRGKKKFRPRKIGDVIRAIEKAFEHPYFKSKPQIFNSGELSDSLMSPLLTAQIADKFEEQDKHKLLLLTKSAGVNFLLKKSRRQTIVSFSVNIPEVWERWEHKTPPPQKRIEAAKAVSEAGFEVRIRIDPISPIEGWQQCYEWLLLLLFSKLKPERITLGMPRGLQKTLMFSKDLTWAEGLTERTGWGRKFPESLRKEVYQFFSDKLCEFKFDKGKVALCKETVTLSKELKMGRRCNCVW